jgi:TorA maturation chaperone TorD
MRAILYMIAAGLFESPNWEHTRSLQTALAVVQCGIPAGMPCRDTLEAVAHQLADDESLRHEHARLFVLAIPSVAAQPYESYWVPRGNSRKRSAAHKLERMMRSLGMVESRGIRRVPDHIVSELEFMSYMAGLDRDTSRLQRRLIEEHLARWVPRFTEAVRAANPAPRYRLAADYLDQLIAWDAENVQSGSAGLDPPCQAPLPQKTVT